MIEWISNNWMEVAAAAGVIAGAASTMVGVISGYTKWKGDDKAAGWLKWLHDKLSPLAVGNQLKKLAK